METNCSECGMEHEVGESRKDAYMFCLGCDKFFKVERENETSKNEDDIDAALEQSVRYIEEQKEIVPCLLRKTKRDIKEKIKTALKKLLMCQIL